MVGRRIYIVAVANHCHYSFNQSLFYVLSHCSSHLSIQATIPLHVSFPFESPSRIQLGRVNKPTCHVMITHTHHRHVVGRKK
mmetsp:Transcript_81/g.195  ORF Transcript_81/g.195 Transcript_81/m.195 type:complete len:82 (+) Transcript_81:1638-1883(+)